MLATILRVGLFLIPWLTVPFIPKDEFKKFTPVAIFASFLVLIVSFLSIPYKWWTIKGGLITKTLNDLSFILGPFFVGTIWIFRMTFGKFGLFALVNLLMDSFLSFPFTWLAQKLKMYKLVNFKPKHIFYISSSFALVSYIYQLFITSDTTDNTTHHKNH